MDGLNAQYSVRFDGPVDHRQALLSITGTDGKAVSTLRPLLDSASNVLFALRSPAWPAVTTSFIGWFARYPTATSVRATLPFKVKQ